MQIFEIRVNGIDAENFLALSREEKFNFIKENSKQQDETAINEFLDSPMIEENSNCIGCGQVNNKIENHFKDANNITSGNDAEGAKSIEHGVSEIGSGQNRIKRPKTTTKPKN